MRSVNKVILLGHLSRDPRVREAAGQKVVTFSLATNRFWTTAQGEKRTETEFHDIIAWSRLAEISAEHLKKWKQVYVEGYLKTRSWEDESGVRHLKTEIVAQEILMLERPLHEDSTLSDAPQESEEAPF